MSKLLTSADGGAIIKLILFIFTQIFYFKENAMKKLLTLFSVLSLVLVLCFSLSACNVIKEEFTECTDHVDDDGNGICDKCEKDMTSDEPNDEPGTDEPDALGETDWIKLFELSNVTVTMTDSFYSNGNYYDPTSVCRIIGSDVYVKRGEGWSVLGAQELESIYRMIDFSADYSHFSYVSENLYKASIVYLETANTEFYGGTVIAENVEIALSNSRLSSIKFDWTQILPGASESESGTMSITFSDYGTTQKPEIPECPHTDMDGNGICDSCGTRLESTDPTIPGPGPSDPDEPAGIKVLAGQWKDSFKFDNATMYCVFVSNIGGVDKTEDALMYVWDSTVFHEDVRYAFEIAEFIEYYMPFAEHFEKFTFDPVSCSYVGENLEMDISGAPVVIKEAYINFSSDANIRFVEYSFSFVDSDPKEIQKVTIALMNYGTTVPPKDPGESPGDDPTTNPDDPSEPGTDDPNEHECYDKDGDGYCDYPGCGKYIKTDDPAEPDEPEYHICYDYTGDLKCDVCKRDLTSQPGSYVDEETWIAAFNAQNVSYTSNNNYVEDGVVKSDAVYYRIVNGKAYASIDGSVWNEISFPVAVFSFAFSGDYSKFEYIGKTFYAEAINIYYPSEAGMPEGYYILAYDVKVYFDAAGRLESVAYGMKLMMDGTELDDASNEIYFYNYGTTVAPDGSGYPDIPDKPDPDEHEEHYDNDGNGYCDYPDCNLHLHFDNDYDGICDICEYHYYCFDNDYDGMCDVCGDHNRCIDYNGDGFCDYCNFHVSCFDNGSDGCCDFCGDHFECIDNDGDEYCDFCGADLKSYDDVYISEEEWMSAFYFENVSIDGVYHDLETGSLFSATWRLVGGTAYYKADDAADWREDPNELEYVLAILYYGKDFYSFNDYGGKYIAEDMTVVLFGQYIFLENVTVVITDGRVSTISFYVSQTSADDANSGWWEFSFYDYDSTKIPEGFDVPSFHECFDKNGDGICEDCGVTVLPKPAVPEHEHFDISGDDICDFDGCKVYVVIEFPLPNYEQKN